MLIIPPIMKFIGNSKILKKFDILSNIFDIFEQNFFSNIFKYQIICFDI